MGCGRFSGLGPLWPSWHADPRPARAATTTTWPFLSPAILELDKIRDLRSDSTTAGDLLQRFRHHVESARAILDEWAADSSLLTRRVLHRSHTAVTRFAEAGDAYLALSRGGGADALSLFQLKLEAGREDLLAVGGLFGDALLTRADRRSLRDYLDQMASTVNRNLAGDSLTQEYAALVVLRVSIDPD